MSFTTSSTDSVIKKAMAISSGVEIIAHEPLVSTCLSFAPVYEFPSIFDQPFEVAMLGFIRHAPVSDQWTNPAQDG